MYQTEGNLQRQASQIFKNNNQQTLCKSKVSGRQRSTSGHAPANFPINGAAAGGHYLWHDIIKLRD